MLQQKNKQKEHCSDALLHHNCHNFTDKIKYYQLKCFSVSRVVARAAAYHNNYHNFTDKIIIIIIIIYNYYKSDFQNLEWLLKFTPTKHV